MQLPFKAIAMSLGVILGAPKFAYATEDPIPELAARLARLRGEVEMLASELSSQKDEYQNTLQSLAGRRADLEIELQKEKLRYEQILAAQKRQQSQIGETAGLDEALQPVLLSAIQNLEHAIVSGLPFRVEDRLADLAKLKNQVQSGLISSQDAAYRLWQTIEDELRLTKESGLYRQTIVFEGRDVLVDVARIGMVSLYFRTNDNTYGKATKASGAIHSRSTNSTARPRETWEFVRFEDRKSRRQLRDLFDAFKKQVRVGLFELPSAVSMEMLP